MNRHALFLVAGICLAAPLYVAAQQDQAAVAAPMDDSLFDDRIISVYVNDPMAGSGQVLRNASLRQIGGRWMLIGKAVATGHPDEWDAGLTVGTAWDSVTAFYLFTEQEYDEKMNGGELE